MNSWLHVVSFLALLLDCKRMVKMTKWYYNLNYFIDSLDYVIYKPSGPSAQTK